MGKAMVKKAGDEQQKLKKIPPRTTGSSPVRKGVRKRRGDWL